MRTPWYEGHRHCICNTVDVSERNHISPVRKIIANHFALVATTALFVFVAIRILVVAGMQPPTALAIMSSAGAVQVTLGVMVASFWVLPALGFLIGVKWLILARGEPGQGAMGLIALSFISMILFAPWKSALMITALAIALEASDFVFERWRGINRDLVSGSGMMVLALAFFVFLASPAVWLPAEVLTVQEEDSSEHTQIVGYVLNDSEGWASILTEATRVVLRVSSTSVKQRDICAIDRRLTGPSVMSFFVRGTEVPLCSDLLVDQPAPELDPSP